MAGRARALSKDVPSKTKPPHTLPSIRLETQRCVHHLETVDFNGLLVEAKTGGLVDEKVADLAALVALELDHLAHALGLCGRDDGAIAS